MCRVFDSETMCCTPDILRRQTNENDVDDHDNTIMYVRLQCDSLSTILKLFFLWKPTILENILIFLDHDLTYVTIDDA